MRYNESGRNRSSLALIQEETTMSHAIVLQAGEQARDICEVCTGAFFCGGVCNPRGGKEAASFTDMIAM